jgi:NAD(P)-dependent dehydrogenase (short-subunit alcohol dehydrogenase family)
MRILVTGSSRGIGRSTTIECARRGHQVIATARKLSSLRDLEVAGRYELDVTNSESVASVAKAVGDVDVIINAAGAPLVSAPIERHPMADLQEQIEVNYLGSVRVIQAFLPGMRRRGSGTIVNVGSITGRVAQPLRGAANASKFALEGMSEALHYEVSHFGIRVILVEPGATENQPGKIKYALRDEAPEYGPLFDQFDVAERNLTASVPKQTPDMVAKAIADALESKTSPFRLMLGGDAEMVMGVRRRENDVEFERQMRIKLGITW